MTGAGPRRIRRCTTTRRSRCSRRNCGSPPTTTGGFQWVLGGFYSDIERDYGQTLPTPGYDAILKRSWACPMAARAGAPVDTPFFSRHSVRHRADGVLRRRLRSTLRERFDRDGRRPLLRLRGRPRSCTSAALFADRIASPTATRSGSGESTDGVPAARAAVVRRHRELPAERPGGRGLPARRHQRSAEHSAVLGGGRR